MTQPPLGVTAGDTRTWQLAKIRMEAPNGTLLNAGFLSLGNEVVYFVNGSNVSLTITSISDQEITMSRNASYLLTNGTTYHHVDPYIKINRSELINPVNMLSMIPPIFNGFTTTNSTILEEELTNFTTVGTPITWLNYSFSSGLFFIEGETVTPDNNRHYANRTYDLSNDGWLIQSYDKAWRPEDQSIYLEMSLVVITISTTTTTQPSTSLGQSNESRSTVPTSVGTPSFTVMITLGMLVISTILITVQSKRYR